MPEKHLANLQNIFKPNLAVNLKRWRSAGKILVNMYKRSLIYPTSHTKYGEKRSVCSNGQSFLVDTRSMGV